MSDENPIGALGALSTATLGVLIVLLEDLVKSGVLDRARLLGKMEEMDASNRNGTETRSEKLMADSVMKVVREVLRR